MLRCHLIRCPDFRPFGGKKSQALTRLPSFFLILIWLLILISWVIEIKIRIKNTHKQFSHRQLPVAELIPRYSSAVSVPAGTENSKSAPSQPPSPPPASTLLFE